MDEIPCITMIYVFFTILISIFILLFYLVDPTLTSNDCNMTKIIIDNIIKNPILQYFSKLNIFQIIRTI